MKYIKDDREFRLAYEILSMLSENADRVDNPEKLAQHICETKRAIRAYSHRKIGYERRIIEDNSMDGYLSLERLPDDIRDLEQANRFFEEFMTCHYRPSAYDCTGQAMTTSPQTFSNYFTAKDVLNDQRGN